MKFILSTMTNGVSYAMYDHAGDLPVIRSKITIKGGANLPSMSSGFGEQGQDGEGHPIWTAAGVITPIKDEQYEALKDHWLFKKHLASGHVKVIDDNIIGNHKAVKEHVRDMEPTDGFAQLNPKTIKKHANIKSASVDTIDADVQFN